MKHAHPGPPRFDATLTSANVHERAEQVSVPAFDWMSGPVLAFVDGLLHIDRDAPLPRRRRYQPVPGPVSAHPADDAAHSASHLLADLTRMHRR
ncbi:hypothetical protein [Actinoplanes utahensis]|uniref:Uncharacterized protein n=1 Tax=Actinoplanes utahensis TaxID=1869 RepID=A0A0A6UFY2_ACTUT|nr:hypothetical protein [Actinoplanes utahensis]KHD74955.1 hypothetical protein MB27_25325 [Actinoplanes utahensis]GIF34954.1 hypothetical protein Aut01nite_79400 [Actinoplanes utahensis]